MDDPATSGDLRPLLSYPSEVSQDERMGLGNSDPRSQSAPQVKLPSTDAGHMGVVYPDDLERAFMLERATSFEVSVETPGSSLSFLCLSMPVSMSMSSLLHEAKKLLSLSGALVVSSLASFLVPVMTLAFVGRNTSKMDLSVVALASSFFNVTGYAAIVGSLGALETLISNAHGANAHAQKGIILQRSVMITMSMCAAVVLMWTRMYDIMILCGQEPVLARSAADYLIRLSPSLVFLAASDAMKKFFTCQSLVVAPTTAAVVGTVATFGYNWVFIVEWNMGLRGAAMAVNCAQLTPCCILYAWYALREGRLRDEESAERTWFGFDAGMFREWGQYFKLAIPSAAMVALEWGVFECSLLLSGWLEEPALHVAVMGLTLNFSGTAYMLPLGISSATAVRVGNAIGGGLHEKASRSAWVSLTLTLLLQVVMGIAAVLGRRLVGAAFSDEIDVIRATASVVPLIAFCMLGDGVNASIGGTLRGIGRQELGAKYNLLSYWGVGMPLAYVLAIPAGMGIAGLWTGLATCATVNGVIMLRCLQHVDWRGEVVRASDRRR